MGDDIMTMKNVGPKPRPVQNHCCSPCPLDLQVVPLESQENGQKEAKRSRREETQDKEVQKGGKDRMKTPEEKTDVSISGIMENQSPTQTSPDVEMNTGK